MPIAIGYEPQTAIVGSFRSRSATIESESNSVDTGDSFEREGNY